MNLSTVDSNPSLPQGINSPHNFSKQYLLLPGQQIVPAPPRYGLDCYHQFLPYQVFAVYSTHNVQANYRSTQILKISFILTSHIILRTKSTCSDIPDVEAQKAFIKEWIWPFMNMNQWHIKDNIWKQKFLSSIKEFYRWTVYAFIHSLKCMFDSFWTEWPPEIPPGD